ncbi:HAMP domain-containing histidine kinase [Shewanella insulae]|uniref:sensor histidine kinase n=1 Tax=Shewanella insulae TaxID=2681496 RepID=UPI001EFC7ACD|nr:HAMP domain-containing sensor histidine kinase [Shewanella insulae]MCG9712449.1 HAMP domain-containing histidine kinase [Shewanella insulae]
MRKTAKSLTRKLSVYFGGIALLVAAILYLLSIVILYWVEDELNRRTLEQIAPSAQTAFEQGASSPLILSTTITAYNDASSLPEEYQAITDLPLGFLDELHDTFKEDIFILRSQYSRGEATHPLILVMDAEKVELSRGEWSSISLVILAVTLMLFALFGFAITLLTRRLIAPIRAISDQLEDSEGDRRFRVSKDATLEFHALTASLNHYQQEIAQLIRREQAFSRYASHELRTPLTIIQGASRLLEQEGNPEFLKRQRHRIAKAAGNMQQIIDALLSLVKQERGLNTAELRALDEKELRQILAEVEPLASQKQIQLSLTLDATPQIAPSEAVLRMLMINLLNNAINASDSGRITIGVDEKGIWVKDQGRGMSSSDSRPQGHGLGLEIVEALCQRYQWRFSLSNDNEGCIARLHFPVSSDAP